MKLKLETGGLYPRQIGLQFTQQLAFVSRAKLSQTASDQFIVEREQLEPDHTIHRQPRSFPVCNHRVAGPGRVASRRNHCQNAVSSTIEFLLAEHHCRTRFAAGLIHKGEGDNDHLKLLTNHETPLHQQRCAIRARSWKAPRETPHRRVRLV